MSIPYSELEGLTLYVLGSEDNAIDSQVTVISPDIIRNGIPFDDGIYDSHMGTTDHSIFCKTCLNDKKYCPGHYGEIRLHYPIQSPMFLKEIMKWLRVICFNCGKLFMSYKPLKVRREYILNEYVKIARTIQKDSKCVHCGQIHPYISKEKDDYLTIYAEFEKEKDSKERKKIPIYPHHIEQIFAKITPKTVSLLGKPIECHPSKFILRVLRVPPNTIRPSDRKIRGGRSNHSDITITLQNIMKINENIPLTIPTQIFQNFADNIHLLELTYYEMIKGSNAVSNQGILSSSRKQISSIAKRWTRKTGRIRQDLLGRRVGNMGRGFITCDVSLHIDEVGIPMVIAREIHIPEVVREYNYKKMMQYFFNGTKRYPGCIKIQKASGSIYWVKLLKENLVLEVGDIIYRDAINGDVVNFNRQPSLEPSSIVSMKIVVMQEGNSIRMNVLDCPFFNADFDGDAMNVLFALSVRTTNELRYLANPGQFFISYKDGRPKIGQIQDSVIGCAELTYSKTKLNKMHAMQMFAQIDIFPDFSSFLPEDEFSGRDIISILLKESGNKINFTSNASFYNEHHAAYRHYNPQDVKVIIDRGDVKSGVLDSSSIGSSYGSIFHVIHNRYGPKAALDAVFNVQQVALMFMFYRGITIHFGDLYLHRKAIEEIHKIEESLIADSLQITDKLNRGLIIPPIGRTITEFYEEQQINSLNPGGEYWQHILSSIDPENNNLYKEIMHGAKGKDWNLQMMNCAVGQILIKGERIRENFNGRTTAYCSRYDSDPRSRGFIANSYMAGLDLLGFILHSEDNRYQLINRALNTAVTGTYNRMAIKNLEAMIIDNFHRCVNGKKIIQFVYGDDGADPRFIEKVKFPTMRADLSDSKFEELYYSKHSDPEIQKLFDEEFEQLRRDREFYQNVFLTLEIMTGKVYSEVASSPVNVERILDDVIYNLELRKKKVDLSPNSIILIRELCNNLPYILINEIQEKRKIPIPEHLKQALTLVNILIRSFLNYANMKRNNISEKALQMIISEIKLAYANSLISYGKSIGVIAAQSISEPMTQLVLDSHHFSGQSSVRKVDIRRIREIILAKPTEKMMSPTMTLQVREDIQQNKSKVQEVANYIEKLELRRFVKNWQIFFESYGNPVHPNFVHEIKLIKEFERLNVHVKPPADLSNWCIRLGLDKSMLIEKYIQVEEINYKIQKAFPFVFIVYSADNSDTIVFRIYLRNILIKKGVIDLDQVQELVEQILNTVIRGIPGIKSAFVQEKMRSFKRPDGTITKEKIYFIFTDGTNLSAILDNPYIDPYTVQSDSIQEMYELFGIETARAKIIDELKFQISGPSHRHYTIYADEMTYTGYVTSIDRYGSAARNSSLLLQISDAAPIAVIENSAVNNAFDNLSGVSPAIMVGKNPNIGDLYNSFIMDEQMIKEHFADIDKMIQDL